MAFLKELYKIEACITEHCTPFYHCHPRSVCKALSPLISPFFLNHSHGWIMYIVDNGLM